MSVEPNVDTAPAVSDEVRQTTCYMCACRCGINVHMRDGKIRYIEGNRDQADVAMLARRVRAASGVSKLICVGTSATLAGGKTWAEQQEEVAALATQMFGQPVVDSPTGYIGDKRPQIIIANHHNYNNILPYINIPYETSECHEGAVCRRNINLERLSAVLNDHLLEIHTRLIPLEEYVD